MLEHDEWWQLLGDVLVVERLVNAEGHPPRLAHHVGGKLDFTIIQAILVRVSAAAPTAAEIAETMNWVTRQR